MIFVVKIGCPLHDKSGQLDLVMEALETMPMEYFFAFSNAGVVTRAQIDKFDPPPNPAKITDSRAAAYIEEHGEFSWELDALPPRELNRLVDVAIRGIVDAERMAATIAIEEAERARVTRAIARSRKAKS